VTGSNEKRDRDSFKGNKMSRMHGKSWYVIKDDVENITNAEKYFRINKFK